MLVLLILPLGTALCFALGDLIGGSWKEGLTTFLGVFVIGFVVEMVAFILFRWRNPED
ncbi:hypothetical protein [Corynebacterium aquilae]|uniref:hypothetical protein n=1 Tax=Corynebacterium aquilae TaxID=203263 RepID=UPI00147588BF|nr:hypothetical protein [Corynebacterium aquilae]